MPLTRSWQYLPVPGTIAPDQEFTAVDIFCASLNCAVRAETPLTSGDVVIL
jgi:hypothetical protein